MTTHYRDVDGYYLGGFDGSEPPADSIECTPPPDGRMRWVNDAWINTQELNDYLADMQALKDDFQSLPAGPAKRVLKFILKEIIQDGL